MKKKVLIILGLVVIVGLVGLYFGSGPILRSGIEVAGTAALNTDLALDKASLNPFSGRAQLGGLNVHNVEGFEQPSIVQADQIDVQVSPFSLLSSSIRVDHIILDQPVFTLEAKIGETNLGKLIGQLAKPGEASEAPASAKTGESKKLEIGLVRVRSPKVIVAQSALGTDRQEITLDTIELTDLGKSGDGGTTLPRLFEMILGKVLEGAAKAKGMPAELTAVLQGDLSKTMGAVSETAGAVQETVKGGLEGAGDAIKASTKDLKKGLDSLIPGGQK